MAAFWGPICIWKHLRLLLHGREVSYSFIRTPWRVKCRADSGRAEAALTTPEVRIRWNGARLGSLAVAGRQVGRCLVDRGPSI